MSYDQCVAFFKRADKSGDGHLDKSEFFEVMRKSGYREQEVEQIFRYCDTSGDNQVDLTEFLTAMGAQPEASHKQATVRRVFREFDRNGDGEISADELDAVFKELGKYFKPDELKRMIQLADKDKSGTLNYEEFVEHCFH